nr:uncharacterized protein LOC127335783 [Lolium perenne]
MTPASRALPATGVKVSAASLPSAPPPPRRRSPAPPSLRRHGRDEAGRERERPTRLQEAAAIASRRYSPGRRAPSLEASRREAALRSELAQRSQHPAREQGWDVPWRSDRGRSPPRRD